MGARCMIFVIRWYVTRKQIDFFTDAATNVCFCETCGSKRWWQHPSVLQLLTETPLQGSVTSAAFETAITVAWNEMTYLHPNLSVFSTRESVNILEAISSCEPQMGELAGFKLALDKRTKAHLTKARISTVFGSQWRRGRCAYWARRHSTHGGWQGHFYGLWSGTQKGQWYSMHCLGEPEDL